MQETRQDVLTVRMQERAQQDGASVEGMVVVDLSMRPVGIDEGGEAILSQFNHSVHVQASGIRLPAEVEARARAALPQCGADAAFRLSDGRSRYDWRFFLIKPQGQVGRQPLLVIHVKREGSFLDAVRRVSSSYHLTAREEQTLIGLSSGLPTKEMARRMNISPNTVNTFLRLIMVKMGVTTRAGVIAKLLHGEANDGGPQE